MSDKIQWIAERFGKVENRKEVLLAGVEGMAFNMSDRIRDREELQEMSSYFLASLKKLTSFTDQNQTS